MSDTSTSGTTPSGAPAETAGTPAAPAADWGAAAGSNRGSGLSRGKRVSPQASPATASNPAAAGNYQPSALQILKAETEYQNPFASADVAPATELNVASVKAAPTAEASAPAQVAPVAPVIKPTAPAPKPELKILPSTAVQPSTQSWETPAFPYEPAAAKTPAASKAPAASKEAPRNESPLQVDRPVFRPVRRSEVPMLERAPDASGNAPRDNARGGQRPGRSGGRNQQGNRPQKRDSGPRQPRQDRQPVAKAPTPGQLPPVSGGNQPPKKPSGLFGWVKGLFGTAPESPTPPLPGAKPAVGIEGERSEGGNRRRRRRGGRGRSGGGLPQGGPQGAINNQSHGQGHPAHGHGGGEHRPQSGGGRRRGGRGRSDGGQSGQGGQGGQGGGHRHDGGGSGLPPKA